jgi:hypothetical protein
MLNTIVGAGAAGAGAGAASCYGSGSDQKMRVLAAPAPQHWETQSVAVFRHTGKSGGGDCGGLIK